MAPQPCTDRADTHLLNIQNVQRNIVQAHCHSLIASIPHHSSNTHHPKTNADNKRQFLVLPPKLLHQERPGSVTTAGPSRTGSMAQDPLPCTHTGSDLLSQGLTWVVSIEVAQNLRSKPNSVKEQCWKRHLLASSEFNHAVAGETTRI